MNRLDPTNVIYDRVHNERVRAHTKHGAAGNSREDASWDNAEWLSILVEEVGEVAHCWTYDYQSQDGTNTSSDGMVQMRDDLQKELIQVAAMAIAWAVSIDEANEN